MPFTGRNENGHRQFSWPGVRTLFQGFRESAADKDILWWAVGQNPAAVRDQQPVAAWGGKVHVVQNKAAGLDSRIGQRFNCAGLPAIGAPGKPGTVAPR
jgi:hypothetical protein